MSRQKKKNFLFKKLTFTFTGKEFYLTIFSRYEFTTIHFWKCQVKRHLSLFTAERLYLSGAKNCKTFADKETGKVRDEQTPVDGQIFRCYAAMDEARRPNVRKVRWDNFDLLKGCRTMREMVDLIVGSIKETGLNRGGTCRVHIGGDFYSQKYFNAWMRAAKMFPNVVFYSYTKSIKFLLEYITANGGLPKNYVFTCSRGGKYDNLIPSTMVKSAKVFFSTEEAELLGLDVDHTDDLAISGSDDFALVIHGSQPAGSDASKALSANKKKGFTGYSKMVKI